MVDIVRRGSKVSINGTLIFDARVRSDRTLAGMADQIAKRLVKALGAEGYADLNSDGTPYKKEQG